MRPPIELQSLTDEQFRAINDFYARTKTESDMMVALKIAHTSPTQGLPIEEVARVISEEFNAVELGNLIANLHLYHAGLMNNKDGKDPQETKES